MSCGNPPAVVNGVVELVNGTTAWQVRDHHHHHHHNCHHDCHHLCPGNVCLHMPTLLNHYIHLLLWLLLLIAVNCQIHLPALFLQLWQREHNQCLLHLPWGWQVDHDHDAKEDNDHDAKDDISSLGDGVQFPSPACLTPQQCPGSWVIIIIVIISTAQRAML